MDVPEILQQILAASWWPHVSAVSRQWHAQFKILLQRAGTPKNQVEIMAACRADNWLGLVQVAGRANYFYLWHTRRRVHMFCSVEMIRFYEMVFCGVGPGGIDDSLRLAPKYMAMNKDPRVWKILNELVTEPVFTMKISPHNECADVNVDPYEKYLLLAGQLDRLPEKRRTSGPFFWTHGEASWKAYGLSLRDRFSTIWPDFVRLGEFDCARAAKDMMPTTDINLCGRMIHIFTSGYLEGIDYALSEGYVVPHKAAAFVIMNKWTDAHMNGLPLPEGSRGREDLIQRHKNTEDTSTLEGSD